TGVPCIVDLATMREAMADLGGDATKINPLAPAEMVIDHSVIADVFGTAQAFERNVEIEYERNRERYQFLRWGQDAFDDFKVVPPGTGIVHQVNIEHLARVVFTREVDGELRPHAPPARAGRGLREGAGPLARPDGRAALQRAARARPVDGHALVGRAQAPAGPRRGRRGGGVLREGARGLHRPPGRDGDDQPR